MLRHLLDFSDGLWDSGPMTRAIGVALFALVGLAGCTKTVSEMSFSEREALARQIEQRCIAQGTVPGTPRHGQCIQVEAQREVASRERQARIQDARRSRGTVCNQVGYTVICN